MASVTPAFYSVGCNRDPNAVDWLNEEHDVVAFGSSAFVAIYDPKHHEIRCTLRGSKGVINAVRFVRRISAGESDTVELLSAGTDKTVTVWRVHLQTGQVRSAH